MNITAITGIFSVSAQIQSSDVEHIAEQGFKSILCVRPEDEPGSVGIDEIKQAASEHGMAFHYLPVVLTGIKDSQVDEFAALMAGIETPVLAYCRSGNRASKLFQAWQNKGGKKAYVC